ncbi:MAG TPA: hypothetical protein VE820_12045 [Sphingomicrobium sp.]|nr:hypothetical protein [Sphingomicrobium sp.]
MRRIIAPLLVVGTLAWVVACGKPDPVANNATGIGLPAPSNEANPDPLGGPPANDSGSEATSGNAAQTQTARTIPAALQGRWGLTPADCTSARGDAKGLLVVSAGDLRFYESRAVPSPTAEADSDSINGNFSFTGEGQTWTKFETLERKKDTLVRTESNPAASYTYAKC